MRQRIRHNVDHALLGGLIFLMGIVFERTHRHHHG